MNFDWSEFVDKGALYVRLEIPYPPSGGPGGNFGIVGFGTPIDENTMCVFFWRVRKVSGWQRDVWRFLYKTNLEPRHWAVLEQDREILAGVKPGLEKYEMLYRARCRRDPVAPLSGAAGAQAVRRTSSRGKMTSARSFPTRDARRQQT